MMFFFYEPIVSICWEKASLAIGHFSLFKASSGQMLFDVIFNKKVYDL